MNEVENLKSILISIIILAILGLLGYWSFSTLQSGPEHVLNQRIKELQKKNEELVKEVEFLNDEIVSLQSKIDEMPASNPLPPEPKTETPKSPTPSAPTVYKYQDLINELQQLIKDNISMKVGSVGTRVGTVQKFLNIYNKTSNTIDNDYGATTKKLVTTFQKNVGLTADGEAGIGTFNKMIDWLKKQG